MECRHTSDVALRLLPAALLFLVLVVLFGAVPTTAAPGSKPVPSVDKTGG